MKVYGLMGQLFKASQVGDSKTRALNTIIQEFNMGYVNLSTFREYTPNGMTVPITMLALDNMATRKLAVQKWYNSYIGQPVSEAPPILIDGRLEGEQGIIYTLRNKEDYDKWMNEFFEDEAGDEGACTMRATSYNGFMIAANMVAVLNNHIANIETNSDVRVIPYKIEYGFPGFVYDVIL